MPPKQKTDIDTLLAEYESCRLTAESMEKTIWQSSAALGIGLAGSLILVMLRGESAQPPWYSALCVGPLLFILGIIWWFVARRWWSVQHAMFMRMRHIEKQLGIHSLNYIQYLDHPESIANLDLDKTMKDELFERSEAPYLGIFKAHQKRGVQELMWVLPIILLFAWVVYSLMLLIAELVAG